MPYPKLVTLLRQGLKSLYKTASELERRWLKEALLSQPHPRPASGVVKKPQKSGPDDVHQVESPTAANPDLLEARLLSGLAIIKKRLGKRICLSSRRCAAFQRSIFVSFSTPSFHSVSPGSAYGVKEPGPNHEHRVESPTAVKPELWESQLLSGLAIMQERLGKRVRLPSSSSKDTDTKYVFGTDKDGIAS